MHRRRVIIMTGAVFAIGVAFAAPPLSVRADRAAGDLQQRTHWVPGTNMLMSAHELDATPVAPPR